MSFSNKSFGKYFMPRKFCQYLPPNPRLNKAIFNTAQIGTRTFHHKPSLFTLYNLLNNIYNFKNILLLHSLMTG